MTESALNSAFASPEGLETGNAWLAAFRRETGMNSVLADSGDDIPLPKAAGDGLKGSLDEPRMVEEAIRGAAIADRGAALRVQAALEAVRPKGFVAIVSAAIAATATIVGSALAYASARQNKKAAKIAAETARLKAEAEQAAAEAARQAAAEKTKQTAMLAGGGALILALIVWGLS